MELLAFFIIAILSVISALGVILLRNAVHSALSLVVNFFCLAIIYLLLRAPFIAAIQIIVYAGAIMVLFLFVIMLLNLGKEEKTIDKLKSQIPIGVVIGLVFLFELLLILKGKSVGFNFPSDFNSTESIKSISRLLFTDYLFPFEVTSVLLLVAILGVIVLAKKQRV